MATPVRERIAAAGMRQVDGAGLESFLAFASPSRLAAEATAGGRRLSARTAVRALPDARSLVDALLDELVRSFRHPPVVPRDAPTPRRLVAALGPLGPPSTEEARGLERLWVLAALCAGDGDRRAGSAVRVVDNRTISAAHAALADSTAPERDMWSLLIPVLQDAALLARCLGFSSAEVKDRAGMAALMLDWARPKRGIPSPPTSTTPARYVTSEPTQVEAALVAAALRLLSRATALDLLGFLTPASLSSDDTSRWQVARAFAQDGTPATFSLQSLLMMIYRATRWLAFSLPNGVDEALSAAETPQEWMTARVACQTPGMAPTVWGPLYDRFSWLFTVVGDTDPFWGEVQRSFWTDNQASIRLDYGVSEMPEPLSRIAVIGLDERTLLLDAWRLRLRFRPQEDPITVMILITIIERWIREEAESATAANGEHD